MLRRAPGSGPIVGKIFVSKAGCRSPGTRARADDFQGKRPWLYSSRPQVTITIQPVRGLLRVLPPNQRRCLQAPPEFLPAVEDPLLIARQPHPSPVRRVPLQA